VRTRADFIELVGLSRSGEDCLGERFGGLIVNEQSGSAVFDQLRNCSYGECEHWYACSESFQDHSGSVVDPRGNY
jgi:hypothetical protein